MKITIELESLDEFYALIRDQRRRRTFKSTNFHPLDGMQGHLKSTYPNPLEPNEHLDLTSESSGETATIGGDPIVNEIVKQKYGSAEHVTPETHPHLYTTVGGVTVLKSSLEEAVDEDEQFRQDLKRSMDSHQVVNGAVIPKRKKPSSSSMSRQLKMRIAELGLKQYEAAEICGVSSYTIGKIIHQQSTPLWPTIKKIEQGLDFRFK